MFKLPKTTKTTVHAVKMLIIYIWSISKDLLILEGPPNFIND